MTTDITELAQREKFEAWWERTQHNGNPPRFGWECWREGEGYKVDDDESELDGMWEAWKAAGAELVEALEKAQTEVKRQENIASALFDEVSQLRRKAVIDSEPVRNPVLAYADSYRDMAKQGVESVPIWSVITDLERNIAPLYRHAQQPVVPDFETVLESLDYDVRCNIRESEHVYQASKATYDACRAAMLAAAPQEVNHG
ncbi:PF04448 family protein [Klebsiella oxytoca]|nr:PF04448 family protein [Klebsiella oxytoca]